MQEMDELQGMVWKDETLSFLHLLGSADTDDNLPPMSFDARPFESEDQDERHEKMDSQDLCKR